ncbi:hypothetical protein CASFOL_019926 [Castilleja foliolosa]|uniref:DOG1 domain-containing protein n=1 Tax=Castilleja foliolosa TaxID=1961234 RepID=A0ABD3D264_9LAMI
MTTPFNHSTQFHCCFMNWVLQQYQDMDQLANALSTITDPDSDELKRLRDKGIKHFEEYYTENRAQTMRPHGGMSYIHPPWCSTLEKAFMWLGGSRATLPIRLLYAVCGSELNAQMEEYLRGDWERKGNVLAEISNQQLDKINDLQCKTITKEVKLSTKMALLQEEIADIPFAIIATKAGQVREWSQEIDSALAAHTLSISQIMKKADELRVTTMKELIAILTPLQAVDFLIVTKKLHLSIHEWGKTMDRQPADQNGAVNNI